MCQGSPSIVYARLLSWLTGSPKFNWAIHLSQPGGKRKSQAMVKESRVQETERIIQSCQHLTCSQWKSSREWRRNSQRTACSSCPGWRHGGLGRHQCVWSHWRTHLGDTTHLLGGVIREESRHQEDVIFFVRPTSKNGLVHTQGCWLDGDDPNVSWHFVTN